MKRSVKVGVFVGGALLALLITAALAFMVIRSRLDEAGPLSQEKIILVPEGAGMKTIARIFERQGVIQYPRIFVWASRANHLDRNIRAGEYLIPPHTSMTKLMAILRSGQVVLHKLTIPEGLTSLEIVRILEATPGLAGKIETIPAEGSLLCQTYYYIRGDDRAAIITRMQQAMTSFLDSVWPFRADGLPLASPQEAVILASIVEKETGLVDERAHVAGVYINRLRKDMPLQADPTVSYGLVGGAALGRSLRFSDLRQSTPFNTYLFKGLPPQPITNPGALAIKAVLNPMATKDLYFVADGTGGHSFAETVKQHNQNVARWRRLEKARDQH
jgi:UPF0755 protein